MRHAYASYGPAFRLTWESGERIVASPPWNDRFRHWPLPLLDEVRFAKNVAWVLTPSVPVGAADAGRVRAGARAPRRPLAPRRGRAAVVFHAFVPPFAPQAEPWPGAGAAGDGDLRTFVAPDPGAPFELRLDARARSLAVTLLCGARRPAAAAQRRRAGERRRADVRDASPRAAAARSGTTCAG